MSLATDALAPLRAIGLLSPLDVELARALGRLGNETRDPVLVTAALVSERAAAGHACLELTRVAGARPSELGSERLVDAPRIDEAPLPPLPALRTMLAASPIVMRPGAPVARPLVLDERDRLYLARYFTLERRLAEALRVRASSTDEPPRDLEARVARLFRGQDAPEQQLAVRTAAQRRLLVVSGGPGTGKTSTVVRILALLAELAIGRGEVTPRIVMLAPTGKAAARLGEATARARAAIDAAPEAIAAIPERAHTIHRALGVSPASPGRFRHDRQNPLPHDVVVVDEASMVDLALMARLCAAVRDDARLVLLGDRHQLASVEVGAVLGDICAAMRPDPSGAVSREARDMGQRPRGEGEGAWPSDKAVDRPLLVAPPERKPTKRAKPRDTRQLDLFGDIATTPVAEPSSSSPLAASIVELTRSYRFDAGGALGALARAIHDGDADRALSLLASGDDAIALVPSPSDAAHRHLDDRLVALVRAQFAPYARATTAEARLDALDRFRVLCAHRKGALGVLAMNDAIEGLLSEHDPLLRERRPILITENDYSVGLFNGDTGVLDRSAAGDRVACFRHSGPATSDGAIRALSIARLPPHETVYAMSIHKSQGSELDEVAVVLPDRLSRIVSRELLYTAVTRAKRRVTIHASPELVREAIARPIQRASGLTDALRR